MFNLIGSHAKHEYHYGGWRSDQEDIKEIVATFDSVEGAWEYVGRARLKNANTYTKWPFRKKSLLNGFEHARVEEVVEESPPPHNPTI